MKTEKIYIEEIAQTMKMEIKIVKYFCRKSRIKMYPEKSTGKEIIDKELFNEITEKKIRVFLKKKFRDNWEYALGYFQKYDQLKSMTKEILFTEYGMRKTRKELRNS